MSINKIFYSRIYLLDIILALFRAGKTSVEEVYGVLLILNGKVKVVVCFLVLTHFKITLACVSVIFGKLLLIVSFIFLQLYRVCKVINGLWKFSHCHK